MEKRPFKNGSLYALMGGSTKLQKKEGLAAEKLLKYEKEIVLAPEGRGGLNVTLITHPLSNDTVTKQDMLTAYFILIQEKPCL